MEVIITTFHLDWKLIIAQLINFGLVVGILWYFAFRPLTTIMNQRTEKIEKGLKDAAAATERLKQVELEKAKEISQAKEEAKSIIMQAYEVAEKQKLETIQKAKEEVAKTLTQAKEQISQEKTKMMAEVKTEAVELISLATGQILKAVTDKKINQELIENALEEVAKVKK